MLSLVKNILSHDRPAFFVFAALSALALAGALVAQFGYDLSPCELCLMQRAPFVAVILLSFIGLAYGRKHPKSGGVLLGLIALAFFGNSALAFFHTGVERHWWTSFSEGCTVPPMKGNITDVLAQIVANPVGRCDEIPWTDPVIGLSMANYNVQFCLILGMAALYALKHRAS